MHTKSNHKFNFPKRLALTFILVAALLFFAPSVIKMNTQQSKIDKEISSLKAEIAAAEGKNSDLKKMIDYLESDAFLDEQARLNFNLKKNGEKIAVVKTGDGELSLFQPSSSSDPKAEEKKRNNYQKWIDYFFKPKA